ncbi:MBL fold metallo-hydrolase [Heyndrickxia sp. NPDC080065]|uniref:MBL fold metallo-hydrolase n=1 Tax=Heyndrickxia sp. NPDC080065 TaxID=3390568 RepID=UPI003CFD1E7D
MINMVATLENTRIRFWGGLRTIGGTIVTVDYKDSRVIFDFGLIFNPGANVFDEYIKTRNSRIVHDYVKLGLVPSIDGIYQEEDIKDIEGLIPAGKDSRQTGVIISHLHLDHMGGMGMLSPEIPVYMTKDSIDLYHALEVIGEGVPGHKLDFNACHYGETFQIGEIRITPICIDHDVLGACAFHIQTPDGALLYTGDFRLHGKNPERIEAAINKAKELEFDVLIMEGTTLRSIEENKDPLIADSTLPENLVTETGIVQEMATILNSTSGLGLFNIYHRNIDRLEGIVKVGSESHRTVVFEPETAFLVDQFLDEADFSIYLSAKTKAEQANGTLPSWKKELLARFKTVDSAVINEKPASFFLQNSYENSLELLDLNIKNGAYLHSNGMPLGDYDPAYHNLMKFLKLIDLERYYVGTGGHAIPSHLKYVLETLNPKTLIPLHSFSPERLVPDHGRQLMPEYGVTYVLKENNIQKA